MTGVEDQLRECQENTRRLEERERYFVSTLRKFVDVFIYHEPSQRDQVFICYSHKDIVWLRRLKTMLAPLIKDTIVNVWEDTMIVPGKKWRKEIQVALKSAKVAVLIVSPEFLESEFIRNNELPQLLKAEEAGDLKVVWFPVASSLVDRTAISEYQAAINPAKPLDKMRKSDQGEALERVARVIEEAYRR